MLLKAEKEVDGDISSQFVVLEEICMFFELK